jgi:hypothetical protein
MRDFKNITNPENKNGCINDLKLKGTVFDYYFF